MIEAMLASIGEQGYATTVVADVIAKAVASRKTFYEHFEDKHACFFAMSEAMLASIGEQGYATTVVADVIAKAVASRKTFYEHFEDKHACFFAMSDEIASEWVARVERAEDTPGDGRDAIDALVNELFALALESPAALRVLAVEL